MIGPRHSFVAQLKIKISPSTGLTSIPLEPYGSPADTTGTRDVTDVTELSRTTFDPALTARDTLDRIELMEKRFADQDAA